ncbi:hypothetical protein DC31_00425 [Microbacterium sp. CH12i]|nr:hypothetical protein DC31_00425 [Microbacterium sp. CH12i]
MKALTWQGKRKVTVEEVDDPSIELPTDAIIKVTSSAICGSDLHLYELLGPFIDRGDILGHEPMGTVVEVGANVTQLVTLAANQLGAPRSGYTRRFPFGLRSMTLSRRSSTSDGLKA